MILKPIFKLIQPLQIRCYFFDGLFSGIGQILGSAISGGINSAEARAARDWQEEMWNKQNEYNLPANQMKRLQDAGLNPAILAAGGTANTSAPVPSSPARGNWDIKLGNLFSVMKDMKLKDQQLEAMKHESEFKEWQATEQKYKAFTAQDNYNAGRHHTETAILQANLQRANDELFYAQNEEQRAQALHQITLNLEKLNYDKLFIEKQHAQEAYDAFKRAEDFLQKKYSDINLEDLENYSLAELNLLASAFANKIAMDSSLLPNAKEEALNGFAESLADAFEQIATAANASKYFSWIPITPQGARDLAKSFVYSTSNYSPTQSIQKGMDMLNTGADIYNKTHKNASSGETTTTKVNYDAKGRVKSSSKTRKLKK